MKWTSSVCPEKGILRSALVACASAIVLTRVESGGSVRVPRRECRFRMRSARTAPWVTRSESEMDDVMVMSGGERASFRARGLAARRFFGDQQFAEHMKVSAEHGQSDVAVVANA